LGDGAVKAASLRADLSGTRAIRTAWIWSLRRRTGSGPAGEVLRQGPAHGEEHRKRPSRFRTFERTPRPARRAVVLPHVPGGSGGQPPPRNRFLRPERREIPSPSRPGVRR